MPNDRREVMTAKGIMVALSAVAVLGVLAVMVTLSLNAAPTAAQEPPPPAPTVLPEATPESISAGDDADDAGADLIGSSTCRERAKSDDLYFSVNGMRTTEQGKTLTAGMVGRPVVPGIYRTDMDGVLPDTKEEMLTAANGRLVDDCKQYQQSGKVR